MQTLAQRILSLLPSDLTLEIHPHWGQSAARPQIRQAIWTKISSLHANASSALTPDWVNDLKILPTHELYFISISHCPLAGGFLLGPKPLGLDLEAADRITEPVLARVSTQDEIAGSPSPAHLWVAKESAYKSFSEKTQPKVLSQILIDSWKTGPAGNFTFSFKSNDFGALGVQGWGLTQKFDNLIVGIATQNT